MTAGDASKTGALGTCLRKALRGLTLLAGVALALMMFVTVADVVLRNFFAIAILGTYDIVETLMVFVVFLGIGEAFQDDTHITVDVIDYFVKPVVVRVLKIIALILSMVFLAVLLRYMLIPAWEAYTFNDRKPDLPIALALLWLPCLIGVFASLLAVIFKLACSLRRSHAPTTVLSVQMPGEPQ